ncbi:MAG TPA: VWA domain-containing protein [Terriglobales bacterium]|nr:VWA domain-containing protein [Terriglobales bacterium]
MTTVGRAGSVTVLFAKRTFMAAAAFVFLTAVISQNLGLCATNAAAEEQVPLFRAKARVVLIDVLVTDRRGNPVRGLTREDFTLADDGAAQTISGFEEHEKETPNEQKPPLAFERDSHTNWITSPSKGAANIILFDLLNCEARDQLYGRQQMLNLLRQVPPGEQIALFALTTRLHKIQDFTSDPNVLIAATEKRLLGGGPFSLEGTEGGDTFSETEIKRLRVVYTLNALRDLGKATASLSGRKNVIWLTTGFPMVDRPTDALRNPRVPVSRSNSASERRDFTQEVRRAAEHLAGLQVALYPIDLKGLVGPIRGLNDVMFTRGMLEGQDERFTLSTLAQETGGRAYYDKNDLHAEIARVLTKDSNYYTLAYTPRNIAWDGSYHKVKVKVARKHVDLTHRRGYYALGDSPLTEEQASRTLGEALGLESMDSRMIVLAAQMLQPEAPGQPVKINYHIDPSTLVFDDAGDSMSALLAVGATAWDENKQKAIDAAKKVNAAFKPSELATAKTSGIPFALELKLNPGTYTLKLAVVDLKSGRTGSLSAPLRVEGKAQQVTAEGERAP